MNKAQRKIKEDIFFSSKKKGKIIPDFKGILEEGGIPRIMLIEDRIKIEVIYPELFGYYFINSTKFFDELKTAIKKAYDDYDKRREELKKNMIMIFK